MSHSWQKSWTALKKIYCYVILCFLTSLSPTSNPTLSVNPCILIRGVIHIHWCNSRSRRYCCQLEKSVIILESGIIILWMLEFNYILVTRRVSYWWKRGCFTTILGIFPHKVKNIIFTWRGACEVALTHTRWDWNEHQKWTLGGPPIPARWGKPDQEVTRWVLGS